MSLSTTPSTARYFQWVADAIREALEECGGVMVQSREQILAAAELSDSRLRELPDTVRNHFTLGLVRRGIGVAAYVGYTPETLLIWNTSQFQDEQAAREAFRRHSLGKAQAKIATFDARPRGIAVAV
jgi:hypothetical protein